MKISTFWDIILCSPLKVNRRFGGTCRLHLQGRRISQERNEYEADRVFLKLRPVYDINMSPLQTDCSLKNARIYDLLLRFPQERMQGGVFMESTCYFCPVLT
jgi:hypothetical protein